MKLELIKLYPGTVPILCNRHHLDQHTSVKSWTLSHLKMLLCIEENKQTRNQLIKISLVLLTEEESHIPYFPPK